MNVKRCKRYVKAMWRLPTMHAPENNPKMFVPIDVVGKVPVKKNRWD